MNEIKEKLNNIVKEMIEKHEGGTEFFDNLDDEIKNSDAIIEQLFNLTIEYALNIKTPVGGIIVSGDFGRLFSNVYDYVDIPIISVNGGLRNGNKIDDLSYLSFDIIFKNFIFIDDSFYSGSTRNAIKDELERIDGNLLHTFVAYDGSKEKDKNVTSLYRYYDNH